MFRQCGATIREMGLRVNRPEFIVNGFPFDMLRALPYTYVKKRVSQQKIKKGEELLMKVSIDKDLCTGCGLCVDTVPDVFELVDDLSSVKVVTVKKSLYDAVREAADDCPTEAIIIEE
jgi:ferredoxin